MTNRVRLAFAATAAMAFAASAADYYVSTTGNDANDGLAWATAKASIAGAYALASDSTADTIHVADGTYTNTAAVFIGKPCTIASENGAASTVL